MNYLTAWLGVVAGCFVNYWLDLIIFNELAAAIWVSGLALVLHRLLCLKEE